jgi:hypothetical protein
MSNLENRVEKLEARQPPIERVVFRTVVHENNIEEIAAADKMAAQARAEAEAIGKDFLELRHIIVRPKERK